MALENLTQITSVGISTGITFSGVTTHTGTIKGTDADFTGNVSVGGTLTYEDVKNIDSVGIITARGGIFLPDNKKVQLGNVAGTADFEIAHDTNNTVIQNRTGALYFKGIGGSGNNIIIEAKNNENSARFLPDGACELYFNGAKTVETTVNALHLIGNTAESNITCKTSDGTTRGILGVTNSNSVTLYSGSSTKALEYASNALTLYHTGNAKLATASTGVIVTGDLKLNQSQSKINLNTSDGSDNKYLSIGGGGDASQSRGAGITLYGNEVSSHEGRLQILAGNSGNANGIIQMHTGGAERLHITSTGDLSLRSTTQNAHLGLTANSTAINFTLGSTAGASPRMYFYGTGNGQSSAGDIFMGAGTGGILHYRSAGLIKLEVNSDNTTAEALRIEADGDIGLGTNAPNKSGYSAPVVSIGYNTSNNYSVLELLGNKTSDASISTIVGYNVGGSSRVAAINLLRSGANNSGAITFETYASGSAAERLRIGSDGTLTVSSETVIINRNAGDPYLTFQTSGTSNAVIYGGASTGLRGFTKPSGGSLTERVRITPEGFVGIGEDVPDLKLHVNGTNALPATTGSTAAGHLCLRDKAGNASHGMYMGVSHQSPWSSWIQAQDGNALGTEYPLLLNPNGGGIVIGNTAATFGSSTLAIEKTSNTIGPRINLYNGASGQAAATCEIHVGQNYRDANRIIFGRENNNNWQAGASGAASYMSIHTNSAGTVAERFRISSGGIVTRPFHSAFKAVGTAGWINFANGWNSLGGSASGTINPGFNTTDYNGFDNQNEFNETNGRFVATMAGDYYFWYMMYIKKNVATQSNYIHINPYVNDSNRNAYTIYGRQQAISGGTHIDGATGGWAGALAAGDYFNWYVYCDGANNFQVYGGHCVMGGWLIG